MSRLPNRTETVSALPDHYEEVYHLSVTDGESLAWLNILSFLLFVPFYLLMRLWDGIVGDSDGIQALSQIDTLFWIMGIIGVFLIHEWLHGQAIRWTGHRPRYGAKYVRVGPIHLPYVLFATADDAYFRRFDFVIIALVPVVVITLVGMGLLPLFPPEVRGYLVAAVVLNGGGSIGDLWMTVVVIRAAPDVLVLDQEDAITVYAPAASGKDTQNTEPPSTG